MNIQINEHSYMNINVVFCLKVLFNYVLKIIAKFILITGKSRTTLLDLRLLFKGIHHRYKLYELLCSSIPQKLLYY